MAAERIERQLEELEALEAIFPDEYSGDQASQRVARSFVAVPADAVPAELPMLSCTIKLGALFVKRTETVQPMLAVAFPHEYPEAASPQASLLGDSSAVDDLADGIAECRLMETCFEEHRGEECTMQLVMCLNEYIEQQNEKIKHEHELGQASLREQQAAQNIFATAVKQADEQEKSMIVPKLGRRLIYSHHVS